MNTGEKIKYFRLAHGITQEQLAQDAEISHSTLRKYEANERNPKYEQLLKIADALGISVNIFTDFDIRTMSDLLSLIFKMNEQLDLQFNSEKNAQGNIIPDTLNISFQNPLINEKLSAYVTFLEQMANTEEAEYNQALEPSFLNTTNTVLNRIFISIPIFQFSIYSLSSLTTSSKSVISLRPLTCHIPVIPGLIANLAR